MRSPFSAGADDTDELVSGLRRALHDVMEDSDARATTDADHGAHLREPFVAPQRAHQVLDRVADLEGREHRGGLAEDLEDDRDGAVHLVLVGHRERRALAGLVDSQHDELPRVDLPSDRRRLDRDRDHVPLGQLSTVNDRVHPQNPFRRRLPCMAGAGRAAYRQTVYPGRSSREASDGAAVANLSRGSSPCVFERSECAAFHHAQGRLAAQGRRAGANRRRRYGRGTRRSRSALPRHR